MIVPAGPSICLLDPSINAYFESPKTIVLTSGYSDSQGYSMGTCNLLFIFALSL